MFKTAIRVGDVGELKRKNRLGGEGVVKVSGDVLPVDLDGPIPAK